MPTRAHTSQSAVSIASDSSRRTQILSNCDFMPRPRVAAGSSPRTCHAKVAQAEEQNSDGGGRRKYRAVGESTPHTRFGLAPSDPAKADRPCRRRLTLLQDRGSPRGRSSARAIAQIKQAASEGVFNTVMGEFNIGAIEEADLMRSIKLFGNEVIPALREFEPY